MKEARRRLAPEFRSRALEGEQFMQETCTRQGIGREPLTIHADRGSAMTAKSVAVLLADLGVSLTSAYARYLLSERRS